MSRARDNASGTFWLPGQVIQVQQVQSSATRTISSQDIAEIAELTITFTPRSVGSKILLTANVASTSTYVHSAGFLKNGSYLANLSPNSNAAGSVSTYYYDTGTGTGKIYNNYMQYADTSTSLSAIVYKVGVSSSWAGSVGTVYINDRDANDMRSSSSFMIQEIAQ